MSETTRCTLHLIALDGHLGDFRKALQQAEPLPFVAAKVAHWVVPPEVYSVESLLQEPPWDIALCYATPSVLPESLKRHFRRTWTVDFEAPTSMLSSYAKTHATLASDVRPRSREMDRSTNAAETTTASAQTLELTLQLREWMNNFSRKDGDRPITMLNLHAYKDVEKYGKYREAFGKGAGARHGAQAKLFGRVVGPCSDGQQSWDLVALIHYPSILHFGDMLVSEDYQEISHKYREGSLIDNPLLCLSEFSVGSE